MFGLFRTSESASCSGVVVIKFASVRLCRRRRAACRKRLLAQAGAAIRRRNRRAGGRRAGSSGRGAGRHAADAAQGAVETVTGEVAETMDASNYTYMRVKTAKGDVWVATAKTKVAVGEKVVVPLESEMRDFHSPSLNRDFPLIYFVTRYRRAKASRRRRRWRSGTGWAARAGRPQAPVKVEADRAACRRVEHRGRLGEPREARGEDRDASAARS